MVIQKYKTFQYTRLLLILMVLSNIFAQAQAIEGKDNAIVSKKDSATTKDSIALKLPEKKKSDIQTTVKYKCDDSLRFDVLRKVVMLYGNATVDYGNISLKSERIEIDYGNNSVRAYGTIDSTGKYVGRPQFKDESGLYVPDSMRYNFTSKKAIVYNVETKQGDGYIIGNKIKKNPENEMFVRNAQYTTCDHKHPHFGLIATKIKVIPNKKIISGPAYLHIAGVPTPLVIPFGFFPSPKKRSSGIIIPGYGESQQSGFFFERGGFFWAINEYMGARIQGDIYTNGGFRTNLNFDYAKRYKYSGLFTLAFSDLVSGFGVNKRFLGNSLWVTWSHAPRSKGRSRFTANVQGGMSNFNRQNSTNIAANSSNTFNSVISFSTTFPKSPFNLGITLRHDQNVRTKVINFDLPNVNLSMNQRKPFQNLKGNFSLLKNLGIAYNSNFTNKISTQYNPGGLNGLRFKGESSGDTVKTINPITIDSLFNINKLLQQARYGMTHNFTINSTAKVFKYFNFNPSVNLNEYWYDKSLRYRYSPSNNAVIIDTLNGFARGLNLSSSASVNTTIYGILYLNGKRVQKIRHTMRPTVSFIYTPDLSKTQGFGASMPVQVDGSGTVRTLSYFEGNGFISGKPSSAKAQSLSFSLDNTLEMKVKGRGDTSKKYNNVKIFDNIGLTANYNMLADSLKWSNLNVNARTMLFNKININSSFIFDPYKYVNTSLVENTLVNVKTNEFLYEKNGIRMPLALSSASLALSTSFNPNWRYTNTYTPREEAIMRQFPHLRYIDFNLPWNLSTSLNYQYNQTGLAPSFTTQTANFTGDVKLTESWKVSVTSGYDFVLKRTSITQFTLYKDLHCWQMNMTWSPFSPTQTFSFYINVKSSMLQDLKLQKNGRGNL